MKRQRRTTQAILESGTASPWNPVCCIGNAVRGDGPPGDGAHELRPAPAALKEDLGVDWSIRCEGGGSAAEDRRTAPRIDDGPPSAGLSGEPSADPLPPPPPLPEDNDIPDDPASQWIRGARGTVVRDRRRSRSRC